MMENSMGKSIAVASMPAVHAKDLLPRVVSNDTSLSREKEKNLEETHQHNNNNNNNDNGRMSLVITHCTGETQTKLAQVIAHYVETLEQRKIRFLGYPTNEDLNYEALAPLLHFHLNNAGDPFIGNGFTLNSTEFEVCVLDWFAKLWEIEKGQYWGYVTTGGTEGNLHGLLVGREQYPDGILYTSLDSHYSIFKIARMYRMQCVKVDTLVTGEIDCVHLKALLLAHKDKPAIINLNIGFPFLTSLLWSQVYIALFMHKNDCTNTWRTLKGSSIAGTTMKGAVDDPDLVIQTLEECGFSPDRFYIHCDGALFGIMIPFVNKAPRISFKKPIGSITISGHKFLGCPIPCGVIITRLEYMNTLSRDIEVIASRDATITGSRSGHAPIFLWYALQRRGIRGLEKEVQKCIANARHLLNQLHDAGIGALLNEFSCTVVFERPLDDEFVSRWSLACNGNLAHVVVMQHVTIEMLDSFVNEFIQKRSIWFRDGIRKPLCITGDIGAVNCNCDQHN